MATVGESGQVYSAATSRRMTVVAARLAICLSVHALAPADDFGG
jgi:hypothetical protein